MNASDLLPMCSLNVNTSCWNKEIHRLNKEFAMLMVPVELLMGFLMIVGIIGNTLVLIVYILLKRKTTAQNYIVYLSAIDLLACVVIHPYVIYKLFNNYNQTWTVTCKIFEFIVHTSLALSGLTLMVIAVDRYLAICRPVKFLMYYTKLHTLMVAVLAISVGGSLPILEFYGPRPEQIVLSDIVFVGYHCDFREKYQGSIAMLSFCVFVLSVFVCQIISMAVLYTKVAVAAYRSTRTVAPAEQIPFPERARIAPAKQVPFSERAKVKTITVQSEDSLNLNRFSARTLQSLKKKHQLDVPQTGHKNASTGNHFTAQTQTDSLYTSSISSTTTSLNATHKDRTLEKAAGTTSTLTSSLKAAKLLFLITLLFIISWMPFFIIRMSQTIDKSQSVDHSPSSKVIEHFLNHCFYINNAVNPIVYSIINKNFRRDCLTLFKRQCRRQRQ